MFACRSCLCERSRLSLRVSSAVLFPPTSHSFTKEGPAWTAEQDPNPFMMLEISAAGKLEFRCDRTHPLSWSSKLREDWGTRCFKRNDEKSEKISNSMSERNWNKKRESNWHEHHNCLFGVRVLAEVCWTVLVTTIEDKRHIFDLSINLQVCKARLIHWTQSGSGGFERKLCL